MKYFPFPQADLLDWWKLLYIFSDGVSGQVHIRRVAFFSGHMASKTFTMQCLQTRSG